MRSSVARINGKSYSKLSGVIAIYKPQGISTSYMLRNLRSKLLLDLNENYLHEIRTVKQCFLVNWTLDRDSLQKKISQDYWAMEASDLEKQVMDVLSVNKSPKTNELANNGQIVEDRSDARNENFLQTYTNLSLMAYSHLEGKSRIGIEPPKIEAVSDDGKLAVVSVPSFASHPAVCGQPYKNLSVKCVNVLDKFTCGVQLYVLGHHSLGVDRLLRNLVRDNLWQKFEVIGEFGLASDDFTIYGKLREKSTYTHIRKKALEQVIQVFTRGQRKLLFQQLNTDVDTQDMYDRIVGGVAMPHRLLKSYIHRTSIETLNLPFVKLEMLAKKCNGLFCRRALHQIGLELRSNAAARKVRLTEVGPVNVDHSLLLEEVTVERVIEQLPLIKRLLIEHRNSPGEV